MYQSFMHVNMATSAGQYEARQRDTRREEYYLHSLFLDVCHMIQERERITDQTVLKWKNDIRTVMKHEPWKNDQCQFAGINFNKFEGCCVYLQTYAALHALIAREVCCEFLEESPYFSSRLNRSHLSIVSVGGGPGNDLIGFCSAISAAVPQLKTLNIAVVDAMKGWKSVFFNVVDTAITGCYGHVTNLLRNTHVTKEFETCDLYKDMLIKAVESADIVLMTKVLSVVHDKKKSIMLSKICRSLKPGATFLYIDLNATQAKVTAAKFSMYELYDRPKRYFRRRTRGFEQSISGCSYEVCAVQKPVIDWDFKENVSAFCAVLCCYTFTFLLCKICRLT